MPRVVVVGAGAAGTMAAIFAASEGAETVLVERTKDGGRKILISGGGRCNILPARARRVALCHRLVTASAAPHRALVAAPRADRVLRARAGAAARRGNGIGKAVSEIAKRARRARQRCSRYARRTGVTIVTDTLVTGIRPSADRWIVERQAGDPLEANAVVLATGGLSVPNTGSDGRGLRIAEELGHALNPTYAALTPLIAKWGRDPVSRISRDLAAFSLPVTITARSGARTAQATGGFLFTHQRLQRAVGARRVARRRAIARTRQREPARITVQWTPLRDSDWEAALRAARSAHGARRDQRRAARIALPALLATPPASSPAARSRNSAATSGCD